MENTMSRTSKDKQQAGITNVPRKSLAECATAIDEVVTKLHQVIEEAKTNDIDVTINGKLYTSPLTSGETNICIELTTYITV
jgi:hypothetical protein